MPFKSLASLKKVANLGAEVVAIAPLEGDKLVGVLTNDPVQVAVIPYATGTTKTKTISVDDASSLALITKNAAVIKTGHELWGVLDIQHSPKIEQVGRDIRSLAHFPKGGTALAIGYDGNGAALAMEKHEVGGRQFQVRGDVRAATLDMARCYVVINGAGGPGGQLRVHPGQTPESGASSRADLPSDAKGFNRLAGGEALCALTKRGADAVCVIRQNEPTMLAVPGSVVDVAVIETSMFVLCADGKIRLYGGETLARLGTDIIDPTFELDLRVAGASVIMATTGSGNKLWVGTKGGDLVRVDAVKGGIDLKI